MKIDVNGGTIFYTKACLFAYEKESILFRQVREPITESCLSAFTVQPWLDGECNLYRIWKDINHRDNRYSITDIINYLIPPTGIFISADHTSNHKNRTAFVVRFARLSYLCLRKQTKIQP